MTDLLIETWRCLWFTGTAFILGAGLGLLLVGVYHKLRGDRTPIKTAARRIYQHAKYWIALAKIEFLILRSRLRRKE